MLERVLFPAFLILNAEHIGRMAMPRTFLSDFLL